MLQPVQVWEERGDDEAHTLSAHCPVDPAYVAARTRLPPAHILRVQI
jgi:hypothetical protein